MSDKKQENREQFERRLNAKAWKNESFRKKLMSNPKDALKELGAEIPSDVKIHILQETPTDFYLVIHETPPEAKTMSEEALKNISAAQGSCSC